MQPDHYIIEPQKICLENGIGSGYAVEVKNGLIQAVREREAFSSSLPRFSYLNRESLLLPGFIDLHVHGSEGADVMDSTYESMHTISNALLHQGVTGYLATTMTAPAYDIEQAARNVAYYKKHCPIDNVLGLHLEGPFISPGKTGAHHPDYIQAPDTSQFHQWQCAAEQLIRQVTIAPEVGGAHNFIQAHANDNLILSAGHSNATCAQARAGFQNGINHTTHLFNAMSGVHHRHPGLATAVLLDKSVTAELIMDNVHLDEAIVSLALQSLGSERIILVTDAIRAQGMGEGCFTLGGQQVFVRNNEARLANGALAGSVLTMNQAIANISRFPEVSFTEAVNMATINPAKKANLHHHTGSIQPGKSADMILMDQYFNIEQTWTAGTMLQRG